MLGRPVHLPPIRLKPKYAKRGGVKHPRQEVTLLETHLREIGIRGFEREYRFYLPRDWRFDFAIPLRRVAIEIEGGIWTQGRHTRGEGFQRDLDKYNQATAMGWRIFRFSVEDVLTGKEIGFLREYLITTSHRIG
jgi:very-short-patch-repair endonuclease